MFNEIIGKFRTVIIFRDIQELSYDVISNIMELPIERLNLGLIEVE